MSSVLPTETNAVIKADYEPVLTEEEQLKKIKNDRIRQKAKLQREKMKKVEEAKKTVAYQRQINNTRQQYNLPKQKVQFKINDFFKKWGRVEMCCKFGYKKPPLY